MEIKTKYPIEESVYTMFNNKIVKRAVNKILIEVHFNRNIIIEYEFTEGKKIENEVFSTKEELINSLLNG